MGLKKYIYLCHFVLSDSPIPFDRKTNWREQAFYGGSSGEGDDYDDEDNGGNDYDDHVDEDYTDSDDDYVDDPTDPDFF